MRRLALSLFICFCTVAMKPDWTTVPESVMSVVGESLDDTQSICSAGLMCKNWYDGLYQSTFKKTLVFELNDYTREKDSMMQHFIAAHKNRFVYLQFNYADERYDMNAYLKMLNNATNLQQLIIQRIEAYLPDHDQSWPMEFDMTRFPQLPQLQHLRMDARTATGNLDHFCEYYSNRLQSLELYEISHELGATWNSIFPWTKLHTLSIATSATQLVTRVLSTTFDQLAYIDFYDCEMTNEQFKMLVNHPRFAFLEHIDISENNVGDEGFAELKTWLRNPNRPSLDKLLHFDISGNAFGFDSWKTLFTLSGYDLCILGYLNVSQWFGIAYWEPLKHLMLNAEWMHDMDLVVSWNVKLDETLQKSFIAKMKAKGVNVTFE